MDELIWKIAAAALPAAERHCKKCGQARAFECAGKFRVNAQKRRLDVWLIYRCPECGCAWNLEIISRAPPQSIPPALLEGFHRNDAALARRFALDGALIRRAGAAPSIPDIRISGDMPPAGRRVALVLLPECALPVRVADVLRAGLRLSRSELERMAAEGRVLAPGGDALRMKLGGGARVEVEL